MKIIQLFICLITFFLSVSCTQKNNSQKPTISVSIAPLAFLTQQIVDSDFVINTLVPSGASVETYEPTPAQMKQVAESQMYISTGLIDFEQRLNHAIHHNMPNVQLVDVSEGIPLIAGDHHNHHTQQATASEQQDPHRYNDKQQSDIKDITGIDPHIWNSPRTVKQIATNIYQAIAAACPDSVRYQTNYNALIVRLDSLDRALTELFKDKNRTFIIYHPALSYLARDYNLHQISLENEGKEPSAEYLKQLIDTVKTLHINQIFYQQQFSRNSVEALSNELGVPAVPFDPLAPDIIHNTLNICTQIAHP